ncbi:MAG: tyrosine-type recombinase/integrase [Alphaproteobacteria bacterium]|nr:tyrosine-type recombinase/integrase [Alphaproteobacteria bacterium]
MKKIRHFRETTTADQRVVYRFEPSLVMRDAGYRNETLGEDRSAAIAKVEQYNAEWDADRGGQKAVVPRGNINWLIHQFEKDPTWYGAKAKRTRQEMDYAFRLFAAQLGAVSVKSVRRGHCRALYNDWRLEGSAHKAKKLMKWVHRLFSYALELEIIETHPMYGFKMETPPSRDMVWSEWEVDRVIESALKAHKSPQGNIAPPRPSIALATQIAFSTSLPQQDILALTWDQYSDGGLTVTQKKKRGGKELWIPLTDKTRTMLDGINKFHTHIIVNEMTAQRYKGKDEFGKVFRKVCRRAGLERSLTFHDLRTTALTNMGNKGATMAEIVSFSGHKLNSPILETYVKPGREAAKRALDKINTDD